ncbi:hypothetical protein D3C80_1849520 [compost metagenome]
MPLRQRWPSSLVNSTARLRVGTLASALNGLAPPMAKRPTTGTCCWLNTRALDRGSTSPLLLK